jgi:NAD-dependent deacetylase sirtuin 5
MANLASFQEAIKAARYPMALAGAGLSAASGIPTFRGAGGLWRQYDAMSIATIQAFQADPSKSWQFYHYRRELCLKAHPNTAHLMLAKLSTAIEAKQVFPCAKDGFHLITQK